MASAPDDYLGLCAPDRPFAARAKSCDGARAIAKLSPSKLILTNGSVDHVEKVLERLGLDSHFDGVFDIIAAELEPKPAAQTYERFLELHDVDPAKAAMFEDLARNLVIPYRLGMTTVLVVPDGSKEVVREDWELEGRDAAHVDHVTDDLTGFLEELSRRPAKAGARYTPGPGLAKDIVDRRPKIDRIPRLASPAFAGTTETLISFPQIPKNAFLALKNTQG